MKKLLYILAILTVFSSCEKDFEYVFDETVSERIEGSKSNLTSLLTEAEFGWKTVFTGIGTDEHSSGSFIAFKFTQIEDQNNGTVLMNSGFDEGTSEFFINHQEGTVLQFNTPNDVLYWMVEPRAYFGAQGLGGEVEYIFMKEENGKLFFRGKMNDADLVLERATPQDWDMTDIQAGFEDFTAKRKNSRYQLIRITSGINNASEENPFYVRFDDAGWNVEGKEDFTYSATYNVDGEDIEQADAAFVYTHEGIQLSNPIVIEGDTLSKLVFDEAQDKWMVGDKGMLGEFVFSLVPVYPQPGVVQLLFDKSLATADRSGMKGMLLRAYGSEGPMKDLVGKILGGDQEPVFDKLLAVIGYVSPDGVELGDGLVFRDNSGDNFAFVPVTYEITAEHQFKIVRTGGDIITSTDWAGAIDKINNDADINDYLDILCSENGWSVAVDYFPFGIYEIYTFELGNNDNPANWMENFVVTMR